MDTECRGLDGGSAGRSCRSGYGGLRPVVCSMECGYLLIRGRGRAEGVQAGAVCGLRASGGSCGGEEVGSWAGDVAAIAGAAQLHSLTQTELHCSSHRSSSDWLEPHCLHSIYTHCRKGACIVVL